MKLYIACEMDEEAARTHIASLWAEYAPEDNAEPAPSPEQWFRERLEGVCEDELAIAFMFSPPVSFDVEEITDAASGRRKGATTMSWTGSGEATEHGIVVTSLALSPEYNSADEHVKEQMNVAADAATKIIASGALGASETRRMKRFSVQVSGHANPDHEPAEGWANDYVTVNVSQKSVDTA